MERPSTNWFNIGSGITSAYMSAGLVAALMASGAVTMEHLKVHHPELANHIYDTSRRVAEAAVCGTYGYCSRMPGEPNQ